MKRIIAFLLVAVAGMANATTYYIDAEQGDDAKYDGTSATPSETSSASEGLFVGPKRTWEACKTLLTTSGDELIFAKGRYLVESEWTPSVYKLSFKGATGNRNEVVLDGQGETRFIVKTSGSCQYNFHDLTISNFCAKTQTFANQLGFNGGFCHTRSSGSSDNGSNIYMTNVHATCCSAPYGAGGVAYVRQIETHDSLFDFNTATNGGAFATSGNSGGTYFYDSIFRTNAAVRISGVVYTYAYAAPFRSYGSLFEGNSAAGTGVVNFKTEIATNSVFIGNSATNGGAGVIEMSISNSKAVFPIVDCRFIGNTATKYAGALLISSPNWKVVHCTFLNNRCSGNGGAIYGSDGYGNAFPLLRDCTFVGNQAYQGGALYMPVVHILNCCFTNNVASLSGSAIAPPCANWYGKTEFIGGYPRWSMVSNCVFYGNLDGKSGATYDDIYATDASSIGYTFAKSGGILTDGVNGCVVKDVNPFRTDDHCDYAMIRELRGLGLALDWMTADSVDLGGKPRLTNGLVDFGCYQYWKRLGMVLILR